SDLAIDHGLGGAVLHGFTIDFEPHFQILRISNFILGHQPWAGGAESVAGFALGPLASALCLERTLGNIMDSAIACYIIECIFFADIFGGLADNNAQLNFPVGLFRTAWDDQIIIRANNGRSCLHENDRLWRNCHAGFGGVVSIVEADA